MENEQILSAVTQLVEEQKQNNVQHEKINITLQKIDEHIGNLKSFLYSAKIKPPDFKLEKLQEDVAQIKNQLSENAQKYGSTKTILAIP